MFLPLYLSDQKMHTDMYWILFLFYKTKKSYHACSTFLSFKLFLSGLSEENNPNKNLEMHGSIYFPRISLVLCHVHLNKLSLRAQNRGSGKMVQ